ncbi:hypothetical protein SAY86_002262 [Trapa natans]|uniref:Uncharacterized protein n=1 Tax=Trapa natans TaxID=22666 RepID=A0AAN7LPS9_TRANT|nr:hypothetical protein SAY86_002262 [Trapa natans]
MAIEFSARIMHSRYQITTAVVGLLLVSLVLYALPRFVTVLAYFWPLFASTAVFMVVILVFGGISQLANDSHGEKAGKGILDYVAGPGDEHHDQ